MKPLVIQRHVAAAPERTFQVFSDVEGAQKTLSAVTKVELLSTGPVGNGTRWRETRLMFGREASEEMWVDAFDPPRAYSVLAEPSGMRCFTTFTFTPNGSGTDVKLEFGVESTNLIAKLMAALMGPLMAGSTRKQLEKDMDDLKAAAERAGTN